MDLGAKEARVGMANCTEGNRGSEEKVKRKRKEEKSKRSKRTKMEIGKLKAVVLQTFRIQKPQNQVMHR